MRDGSDTLTRPASASTLTLPHVHLHASPGAGIDRTSPPHVPHSYTIVFPAG